MTTWIICVFSIITIPMLILASETQSKDKTHGLSHRNRTNSDLKKSSVNADYHDFDTSQRTHHHHYDVPQRRLKKKRQNTHHAKPHNHAKRSHYTKPSNGHSKGKDVKTYETFEEIHEHINEPDSQYQASERYESHDESGDASSLQNTEEDKQEKQVKIKVKHHHHHHHHNHIKQVVKAVPKPYPVEKIVHVPIEKIIEKIVHVPKIVNVTVEKIVHVPVEKIIEKIVHVPKTIHVPKPYLIEKIMEKIVHVPKPYPVLKTVPYPVEIKVPVTVEKKVPMPFKVEVERKVPVYIHSREPYKYEQIFSKSYKEKENYNYNSGMGDTAPSDYNPNFYSETYKPYKPSEFQRAPEYLPPKNQQKEQHTSYEYPSRNQQKEPQVTYEYPARIQQNEQQTTYDYPARNQQKEQEKHYEYPARNQGIDHTNIEIQQSIQPPPLEQSTSESKIHTVKVPEKDTRLNIIVPDNSTSLDLNSQTYNINKYPELPYLYPLEFIHVQPLPFQSPFRLEIPIAAPSFNST